MSMWAHRVNRIEYAKEASFNVFEDEVLLDMLDDLDDEEMLKDLILSEAGMVDVPVKALRKVLRSSAKLQLAEETIRALKEDIAFARSQNEDVVVYDCF